MKVIRICITVFGLLLLAMIVLLKQDVLNLKAYVFEHEETYLEAGSALDIDLAPLHAIDSDYGSWLVHPCVRYIPEGLGGHKWWMAVTPYPDHNNHYEQPVLYYGDGNDTIPPKKWIYAGLVTDWHKTGYNADPNLFYHKGKLWIIWKEHKTENTKRNCLMMSSYDGKSFSKPRKILEERDSVHIGLTAPFFSVINDSIKILATDFQHQRIDDGRSDPFGRNCLAVWCLEGDDLDHGTFTYQYSVAQNYSEEFNYWHADMATDSHGNYYSIVTPEQGDRILIGLSDNGEHYKYSNKPLLSRNGNMLYNMYKASMVIIGDRFYLFYPSASGLFKKETRIYVQTGNIDSLQP